MELNYAIFRSEPIMTIPDLAQIGSHNKRENICCIDYVFVYTLFYYNFTY